jgi:hypothetical protein
MSLKIQTLHIYIEIFIGNINCHGLKIYKTHVTEQIRTNYILKMKGDFPVEG